MAKRMDQIGGSVVAKGTQQNPMAQVLRTIIETQDPMRYKLPKPPTRYPKTSKGELAPNAAYYQELGVPTFDRTAAGQRLEALRRMHRTGGAMTPEQLLIMEQSGKIDELPSQAPGAAAAREKTRLAAPKSGDKVVPSNTVGALEPGSTKSRFGVQEERIAPEASVAKKIDAPAWAFKGTRAPLEEDIKMVLNAGPDQKEAVQAFISRFGEDAAANYLTED